MDMNSLHRCAALVLTISAALVGCQPAEPVKAAAVVPAPVAVVQAAPGKSLQQMHAERMVGKYEIAMKSDDTAELCIRAGMVANAYLEANMTDAYKSWKGIQSIHCTAQMSTFR